MRILILCVGSLLPVLSTQAQTHVEEQDSLFQYLDKKDITTGVFYDRVYPLAGLNSKEYTQYGNSLRFVKQAWHELHSATYDATGLMSMEKADDKILSNKLGREAISVGYIDYQFNYIDPEALDNGSLYIDDNGFYQNGEGNPYLIDTFTYPMISSLVLNGDYVSFYFDPDLILSNTSRIVDNITIYLGEQKSVTLALGTLTSIYIGDLVDSTIEVSVAMNGDGPDGLQWFNPLDIFVNVGSVAANPLPIIFDEDKCAVNDEIWSDTISFIHYEENNPSLEANNRKGSFGNYRIFYRKLNNSWTTCAEHLAKPVIIIDGFDPGDDRKIRYSYNDEGEKEPGIWNILSYKDGVTKKHLGDTLRRMGYDVIILNFPKYQYPGTQVNRDGGADYIEKNAAVLIKLIQEVNHQLDSLGIAEELVVIGPSMGGLIARFALKYMEDNEMGHNTRLYVSFDSPHLGANIPVGAQEAIRFNASRMGDYKSSQIFKHSLGSRAARQMLIHQIVYKYDGSMSNHYPPNEELRRKGWDSTLTNIGFPEQVRKISLINGTVNGKPYSGCSTMIEYKVTKNHDPGYGSTMGHIKIKEIAGNDNNNPNGEKCEVFYGLKFPDSPRRLEYYNTTSYGNIDAVPGGTNDIPYQIKSGMTLGEHYLGQIFWPIQFNGTGEILQYKGNYSTFIPSVSALAFNERDFNWADNIGNRNLVCTGEIPFDAYFYAKNADEEHVFISNDAAEWVLNEILSDGGQHFVKNMIDPHENDLMPICINEFRTIHHNYLIEPCMDVTWSITPNSGLQIVSSDDDKIVLKGNSQVEDVEVSYKIKNNQGDSIVESFTFDVGFSNPGQIGVVYNIGVTGHPTIINYKPQSFIYHWKLNNGPWELANGPNHSLSVMQGDNNTSTLYLKSENNCGTYIDDIDVSLLTYYSAADLMDKMTVVPNPTNDYWTVNFMNSAEKEISLYTIDGRELYQEITDKTEVRVKAEQLPVGVYMLKVRYGEVVKTKKLIKQ